MEERNQSPKLWRRIFLLAGAALFILILLQTNLSAVGRQIFQLGWLVIPVVAVYGLAFLVDTWSWQLVLPKRGWDLAWFWTLWRIRLVGAAINKITPFVGLGGEPLKAILLKRHAGLGYDAAIASLFVFKTLNLIALLIFIGFGLLAAIMVGSLPAAYQWSAASALAVLTLGIVVVTLAQRLRFASRFGGFLARQSWGGRINDALHHLEALDAQLQTSYRGNGARIYPALLLTFCNWLVSSLEFSVILAALGSPIDTSTALIIGAMVELASAAAFFIPANLGTQEAVLVALMSALGQPPELGLSVSLVRRIRELAWLAWGLLDAWRLR